MSVSGGPEVSLAHGLPRPDVSRAFAEIAAAASPGFAGMLSGLGAGRAHLEIWATLEDGTRVRCFARPVRIGAPALQGHIVDLARFVSGALGKAAVAYRAGRLSPSPVEWVRLLQVYRRESSGRPAAGRADDPVTPPAASEFNALPTVDGDPEAIERFREILEDCRRRLGTDATVLDWDTGLRLIEAFPQSTVFCPPAAHPGSALPYLDATVDVVAIRSDRPARRPEASRVAGLAVVTVRGGERRPTADALTVEWKAGDPPRDEVSIVIPVFNNVTYTVACLEQVRRTLPPHFSGQVIVVDDASTDDTPAVLRRWAELDRRITVVRNAENLGFIKSCNRGAAVATGEILVFLNNDTLPQPGWLPPLVRLLREGRDAGAVGGKLLYPDGRLQEAGGVIFSDGSGCNFGKYDPAPGAPLYSYVREVDYCSGALLATWRAVFVERGGFDTRFAPAYYEDTDFCFALRHAGRRVYYQPESVIVHFEGASSGTDVSAGVKRYQVVNQTKFVEKWQTALERQPEPPRHIDETVLHALATRSPSTRRALVCAPRMPEFDREGGSRRIFHLIELLRDEGWAVSFVAQNAADGERYAHVLQQLGVATYAGEDSPPLNGQAAADVGRLLTIGRFDLAVFAFWNLAERLLPLVRSTSPDTRVVVDSVDLHFLRNARRALRSRSRGGRAGGLDHAYADEMIRELNAYVAADAVLTVSAKEADLLNDMAADPGLAHAVPDMETFTPSRVPRTERKGIVFIGNFRHPPNVEALHYLCREIVPRLSATVLRDHPVYVVGNALETVEGVAEHEYIRRVGWVPSVVPYLERARLSVIPLLHGAGTKRKLIQALMVGTPSVSTRIGVEGLDLEDGTHVLVADDPADFARGVTALVEDQALWDRLVARGRDHSLSRHGRDTVRARLAEVIATVMTR